LPQTSLVLRRLCLAAIVLLCTTARTIAASGSLDPLFTSKIGSGFDGSVMSVRILSDGSILVTGSFSHVNGIPSTAVARLRPDATPDEAFAERVSAALPANSQAAASLVQGDGKILIGGIFGVPGAPHTYLRRLNADGSEDLAFASALDADGTVDRPIYALALQPNGRIVAGGGSSVTHLVGLNPDGSSDAAFKAKLGTGFNGAVQGLAIQANGGIIAVGAFQAVNGSIGRHLARLEPDGAVDPGFAAKHGLGFDTTAVAIAIQPDDRIVVGGFFSTLNHVPSRCVARFLPDGTIDTSFTAQLGSGCDGGVQSLAVQSGGIVIGGSFTTMNGVVSRRLARLNSDGSIDAAFSTSIGQGFTVSFGDAAVRALAFDNSGRIIAGGDFDLVNTIPHGRLARLGAAPVVQLDRSALVFSAIDGGTGFTASTGTQILRLTQAGDGAMSWTAAADQPWVSISPASGDGGAALSVSVQRSGPLNSTQSATLTISVRGAANSLAPVTVTLRVLSSGAARAAFGSFDTPVDGAGGIAGSIPVTGWALDDLEVRRVTICRAPVGAEAPGPHSWCGGTAAIYIGDATFVEGARPDVQEYFPGLPRGARAGWGYMMLTNFLPASGNGTFVLSAHAFDAEGNAALLGTKTITCANSASTAPFGALDTPGQGEVISGAVYHNFGWVLSPAPNFASPVDGGTVRVLIDGVDVGSPAGWVGRSDLQSVFSAASYPGVDHAAAVFTFDTTALANGVHTIAWIVTGSPDGGTAGVGSRYFTVSNTSATNSTGAVAGQLSPRTSLSSQRHALTTPMATEAILGRRGFDLSAPMRVVESDATGRATLVGEELDRFELQFGTAPGRRYSGNLRAGMTLAPLPAGATLDETGAFVWMPGPGFHGGYDFVFVAWDGDVAVERREVRLVLNARTSNRAGVRIQIDTPQPQQTMPASFMLAGWAADFDDTTGPGISAVHVWAYPVNGTGVRGTPLFVGPAEYGAGRPDVAAVFGPARLHTSFGIAVNDLPPGTYDLAVFALSSLRGQFSPAATVRVVIAERFN